MAPSLVYQLLLWWPPQPMYIKVALSLKKTNKQTNKKTPALHAGYWVRGTEKARSRAHTLACLSLKRLPYYLRTWNRLPLPYPLHKYGSLFQAFRQYSAAVSGNRVKLYTGKTRCVLGGGGGARFFFLREFIFRALLSERLERATNMVD